MNPNEHIEKMAIRFGSAINKPESPAIRKILNSVMSDEEARLLLDLPAPTADLAAKYGTSEQEMKDRLLALAQRGLLASSPRGLRFPKELSILHDLIMSSRAEYIPPGIDVFWRELYDGEGWVDQICNAYDMLPLAPLRTIPAAGSVAPETTKLAPHEDIEAIIRANADLISIRDCCCRNAVKKCDHPIDVCMQFGSRATYDLYRGGGRKVSTDEAIAIARRASDSGLVPMVTNTSDFKKMEFICFCCGCCCLVINPALKAGKLGKILAPSRFVAQVNECAACELCVPQCQVDAITMDDDEGVAVIDQAKCLGCGACVSTCAVGEPITLNEVRPPEYIPKEYAGLSFFDSQGGPMG